MSRFGRGLHGAAWALWLVGSSLFAVGPAACLSGCTCGSTAPRPAPPSSAPGDSSSSPAKEPRPRDSKDGHGDANAPPPKHPIKGDGPPVKAGGDGGFTTTRGFLIPAYMERPDYGMYSYLLCGSKPTGVARERFLAAIDAILLQLQPTEAVEKYLVPKDLNILYLPVTTPAPDPVKADWVLEHYDFARATALLGKVKEVDVTGLHIVSIAEPLSGATGRKKPCLVQELSSIPPDLVSMWVKAFVEKVSTPGFCTGKIEEFARRVRTAVGIAAAGYDDVKNALDKLVKILD